MADLIVNGGKSLSGTVTPSGNKNSVLPIFCATLLTSEPVTLKNVPDITDLDKLVAFFRTQGSRIEWDRPAGVMRVDHSTFLPSLVNDELPHDMRSTVLLFPALLHRLKKITLSSNAKGCSLGVREIDPHLEPEVDEPLDHRLLRGAVRLVTKLDVVRPHPGVAELVHRADKAHHELVRR